MKTLLEIFAYAFAYAGLLLVTASTFWVSSLEEGDIESAEWNTPQSDD